MLLRGLSNIDPVQMIIQMLYFIPIALITIVVHECSHGYIAYKLGDPTAKMMGRLTANPIKHIDPFGLIMFVVVGFGWAKPVPINPRYFKNPKKGMAITAAAGPISNILMAVAGAVIVNILAILAYLFNLHNVILTSAFNFLSYFIMLNVWFAVFNLIPIPPLDGSRIVSYFLSPKLSYYYNYVERYGFIVLILLLNLGRFSKYLDFTVPLQVVSGWVLNGIYFVVDLIFTPLFKLLGG